MFFLVTIIYVHICCIVSCVESIPWTLSPFVMDFDSSRQGVRVRLVGY